METMYNFAELNLRDSREENKEIFNTPHGVFGVEVTIPALAAQCNLGNLDPQHNRNGGDEISACVAALRCPLPPAGATITTVRPDADSVMAMAVLELRMRDSREENKELVEVIGCADAAQTGPWVRDYVKPAQFVQASVVAADFKRPLSERVNTLIQWQMGKVDLPAAPLEDHSGVDARLSECGRYAIVRADGAAGRYACGAGYKLAPIVVAVNDAFSMRGEPAHKKYTIARWNAQVPAEWENILQELNWLEPGWGGSSSICGSPQGIGSDLTLDQVVEIVSRYIC